MKRLGIFLFVLVLGYIFYYDIKIGTLPMLSSYKNNFFAQTIKKKTQTVNKIKRTKQKKTDVSYKTIEVKLVRQFFLLQNKLTRKNSFHRKSH